MSFADFADRHSARYNSDLIANRPAFNGMRRKMLPENLATLKRMQASEQRSLDSQCPVCFSSGCDHDAPIRRVAPVAVVTVKRSAPVKRVVVKRKPGAPTLTKSADPARKAPVVTKAPARTPRKGNPVTVTHVAPIGRKRVDLARAIAFSQGPRLEDLR